MEYVELNVNPKKRKTGDCAIRAVCQATNTPYEEAAKMLYEQALKTCYDYSDVKCVKAVIEKFGFKEMSASNGGLPRKPDGTKYRACEICQIIGNESIALIQVANHYTCVKGEKLIDIWNCGNKTMYKFWVKKPTGKEGLKVYNNGKEAKWRIC